MPDLTQMVQQATDGMTAAQTIGTALMASGLGAAVQWAFSECKEWRAKKREAADKDRKDRLEEEATDHQQAKEMRVIRIAEYDAIIAQKNADIAKRDADYASYQKFAHDRLDAAAARVMGLQAEQVVTAGQMARVEERLKACEDDRAELKRRVELLENERDQA